MDLMKAKKFFSKPKEDPLFIEKQAKVKQLLLKNLSRAVKETQLLYTRAENGVINDCRPVQRLCAKFEDTLRHGLKAGWFSSTNKPPTFWPVVLKISRKQAIEYINRLQYAQTENGKCRAWIRLAVNECSLESYITVLCNDTDLLNYYYEPHAFLRDGEVVSPLCQLLTGLSQISFNVTVDTASLEFAPALEALEPTLRLKAPQPIEGKKQSPSPSSASTPQSSDSSSWYSSSQESSSQTSNLTPNNSVIKQHTTVQPSLLFQHEVIKDDITGLEASVHIEDDALVVDSVVQDLTTPTTGAAYTNLGRFNLALEGEEEGTTKEKGDKEGKRGRSEERHNNEVVEQEDVVAKRHHKNKQSKGHRRSSSYTNYTLNSTSVSVPHSIPRTSFSHAPPSSSFHYSHESNFGTKETTPTRETTPIGMSIIEATPKETTPIREITSKEATPTRDIEETTPTIEANVPSLTEAISTNESHDNETPPTDPPTPLDEEYSYGDILRLATGLAPNGGKKEEKQKEHENEIHVHVLANEDTDPINETPLNSATIVTTPIDTPLTMSTNPFLEDFIETTPTATTFTPNNPFYNESRAETTPPSLVTDEPTNPFEVYLSGPAPKLSPVLSSENNPFSYLEEEEEEREREERNMRQSEIIRERKLGENERTRIRDNEMKHESFEDTLTISTNQQNETNEIKTENCEELYQNDELLTQTSNKEEKSLLVSNNNNIQTNIDDDYLITTSEELLLPVDVISLHEEHYQQELSMEGIEFQVAQLKNYLRNDPTNLQLQEKLVQLQLLKQEMKEMLENSQSDLLVCGHQLKSLPRGFNAKKCNTCNKPTVGLLKQVLKCQTCGYLTHSKCLPQITRKCLTVTMKEQPTYTMNICPERGLTPQHFRCSNCNQALNSSIEVRLCDYSGQYYCPECHHNELTIIPARVLHNWDFSMKRVCSSCYKLLEAMFSRPLINVQLINPQLYTYVHDIRSVEVLRKDILRMKEFLVKCDRARQEKLIQELNFWPHFKDSSNMFSLSDLIEIQEGNLLSQLQVVHRMFLSHICNECEKCSSGGTVCRLCYSRDVLFPFSKEVTICQVCSSLFHRDCLLSESGRKSCPVCVEKKKRSSRRITNLWKND